jgi:hypothetical protein
MFIIIIKYYNLSFILIAMNSKQIILKFLPHITADDCDFLDKKGFRDITARVSVDFDY